ncbi:MAG: LptF/LptG family permease [Terriglobia bacterium]|nr:LptF/LptG family permease [Terriglobia bacterium]
MRIFTRYILGEVISHGLIGASLFTFVIFMRDLGKLLELVVRNSAPLPSVAEIFFFTLPMALTITLPMGVLVGILIGLSRLAADSEVTAIRASGQGSWMFLRVIAIFAIVTWALAMANSVWIAPMSAAGLGRLQDKLKTSQASFEIQPRVFYEDFKNYVLYVEDAKTAPKAALWKGVFLADISAQGSPKVTVAQQGVVVPEGQDRIRLHLTNGSQQENPRGQPDQFSISTFKETDISIPLPKSDNGNKKELVPVAQMSTRELLWRANHPDVNAEPNRPGVKANDPKALARWYEVEFHRRLALPTSCLVLALVGIPLGLSSRKGGKATGFVLTILLVFAYYLISLFGISLGRSGKMDPAIAVWMANIVFFVAGVFLMWRADKHPIEIGSIGLAFQRLKGRFAKGEALPEAVSTDEVSAFDRAISRKRFFSAKFPLIFDDLILRDFFLYVGMIVMTFLLLVLLFTYFELLSDIVRNKVPVLMQIEYLINVTPSLLYQILPLCVLLAVLVTFGLMQKSNEITAMKATGVSVYRIIFPILVIAAVLSAGLFFFDQLYIPTANTRQETLRNEIKGKPAQTYLRPDRKWIFGQQNTIYYYEFYDPDQNRFANISIFQFDPKTFQMTRRIYAARAHWEPTLQKWVFEDGWARTFNGSAIEDYRTFDVATFPKEATERPEYFKKEVKQSQEMNYQELAKYIKDLQQSGFDVVRLKVQLNMKLAYPVITFVMALLAVPFALSTGRRGALTSVAVAIGIAITYFVASGLFEAMGNANQLPAAMAAWAPDVIFGLGGGYLVLKVRT